MNIDNLESTMNQVMFCVTGHLDVLFLRNEQTGLGFNYIFRDAIKSLHCVKELQIKSFLKKIIVFNCTLKESMFLEFLRLDGKAFHTVGPAWKKAPSPKALE